MDNECYEGNILKTALLEMKMKLPNGVEISAQQYIQETYAPHIPANGRVILSNGAEVPAKQYIEEVLLWEGQSKYNGDINIYFQDEDKTLHITVILYEDMIENENTNMR